MMSKIIYDWLKEKGIEKQIKKITIKDIGILVRRINESLEPQKEFPSDWELVLNHMKSGIK